MDINGSHSTDDTQTPTRFWLVVPCHLSMIPHFKVTASPSGLMSMLQAGKKERGRAKKLITADSILIFFFQKNNSQNLFIAHETEIGHTASPDWEKL